MFFISVKHYANAKSLKPEGTFFHTNSLLSKPDWNWPFFKKMYFTKWPVAIKQVETGNNLNGFLRPLSIDTSCW